METGMVNADRTNGNGPSSSTVDRSSSPLSALVQSRNEEIAEIQSLNTRLASVREAIRVSKIENARLNGIVQALMESSEREKAELKRIYEGKLRTLRESCEGLTSEKTKLEMDVRRLYFENAELKTENAAKCKEVQNAEGQARSYESRCNKIMKIHDEAVADRKKAVDNATNLKLELKKIRAQLDKSRASLAIETVTRCELENTVRTLRDELKLKDELHKGELNETRSLDVSEIQSSFAEQYEVQFREFWDGLRDEYDDRIRTNREKIESLSETKAKSEQESLRREIESLNAALKSKQSRIDASNARIVELEQSNSSLNERINELQLSLEDQVARTVESEAELSMLRDKMQLDEYQHLMDTDVSMSLQVGAYKQFLGGIEQSLKEEPPAKRSRNEFEVVYDFAVESTSFGNVEIVEVDPAETFVKLLNKGDKEVALNGWQLTRIAAGIETVHQFVGSDKLDGGGDLTIWSVDSNSSGDSFGDISLRSEHWSAADEMKTTLVNADGNVEATAQRIRKQRLPLSIQARQQVNGNVDGCGLM